MAFTMAGYKLSLTSGGGAQVITGPNGAGADGPIDVLLRAGAAGIFIGNGDVAVNLPNSGYELASGQEYRFAFPGDGLWVATTSVGSVDVHIFVSPHIA